MVSRSAKAAIRKIAFDTDVLIWYFRGNERARRFIATFPYPNRSLSSLTAMELLQGCRNRDEAWHVRAFVAENFPLLLHPDEAISRRAIDLLEEHAITHGLRVIDAIIAATALETGYSLATSNLKHYRFISRLHLVPFKHTG
ncbi:MAG TPA: type II toxin-antitoxin system VapC family toxin [Acidobacteriota bacterium]|jgi:hypothetical protein